MSTKCFNLHVNECVHISENGLEMFGKPVEFIWIQGIITNIMVGDTYYQYNIDDGTGNLMVIASPNMSDITDHGLQIGDYVLVQGPLSKGEDEVSGIAMAAIEARIISPVKDPNMEILWNLEVVDGMKRSIG